MRVRLIVRLCTTSMIDSRLLAQIFVLGSVTIAIFSSVAARRDAQSVFGIGPVFLGVLPRDSASSV